MKTTTWRPRDFRRLMKKRGMSVEDVHHALRLLGDDYPSSITVYRWARDDSQGPSRALWLKDLATVLRVAQRELVH